MHEDIIELTKKLLNYNAQFLIFFKEARDNGVNYDFHEVVEPFANEVKTTAVEWSREMKKWLKSSPQKYLHLKQIETTLDHMESLSIQAFFANTSRSRFLNANRTVEFFLIEVLKELEK